VKGSVLTPPPRSLGLNHVFFLTKYFLFTKYDFELSIAFITKLNHEGLKHFKKLVMFLRFKVFMVKEVVLGQESLFRWSANFKGFGKCCVSVNYLIRGLCSNIAANSIVFYMKKWAIITYCKMTKTQNEAVVACFKIIFLNTQTKSVRNRRRIHSLPVFEPAYRHNASHVC
jgi:hypothetical protein